MKQNFTKKVRAAITLLFLTAFTGEVNAQCFTGNGYPSNGYFPWCNASQSTIASDCWAGEYTMMAVTSGIQYTFSSSNATDYVTISNEAGTTSYISGTTPIVWTAPFSGNVRFYTHTNAACGVQATNRERRVQCTASIVYPDCTTNITPANGATVPVNPPILFSWNAVPGAYGYKIYLGTSGGGADLIGTTGLTSAFYYGFNPNTSYYWYVVPINAGGSAVFCLSNHTTFTTADTATNDNCAHAIAISGVEAGSSLGATQSLPGCSGNASHDIWYKTTSTAAGDITIEAVSDNGNTVLQVFSGTCGNLTSLACKNSAATGGTESYTVTAPGPNVTYYFRVYASNGSTQSFTVSVSGTALPVTMDKLIGRLKHGYLAELTWKTLSEKNNKGFEIQRSVDGNSFRNVGFVGTKSINGNSFEAIDYSFIDEEVVNGVAYYRLQQTDIDGKIALSNTIRLSAKENGAFEMIAVPNPIKDKLALKIYGTRADNAQVQIIDLSGKVVHKMNITADGTDIDMNSIANGIYLLKYTDATHTKTIKISKQ